MYDLEDSVAQHRKGAAQHMVLQALQAAPERGPELAVRINAPSTQRELAQEDLDVVLQSHRVQAVVIPKVESVDDLEVVARGARSLTQYTYVGHTHHSPSTPLALVLSIESAAALLHMPQILAQARARMDDWEHRISLAALLFARYVCDADASEDYCAATRIKRTRDRQSLLFPRAQLVTTARAYGLQAIVRWFSHSRIWYALSTKTRPIWRMSAATVPTLALMGNRSSTPPSSMPCTAHFRRQKEVRCGADADIGLAQAIWDAYQRGVKNNQGAVGLTHNGRELMIDAYVRATHASPMLLQAQQTLQRAGLLPNA